MRLAALIVVTASVTARAQTLETETARLLPHGAWKLGAALETQRGRDGRERAVPLLLEYGLVDNIELTLEPIPYTAILPAAGRQVRGAGDLEATITYRLRGARAAPSAFAIAGEVKVPTARNALIGTGRADFTAWLIGSRRVGPVDLHANAAYTMVGSPAGIHLRNVWTGALATVYRLAARTELFAEAMGVTAAAPEGEGGDATPSVAQPTPIAPEAAGAELFGTLGGGHYVTPSTLLFASVTYDNTSALMLRTGVTLRLR
jgi:hypothetical protein